MKKKLTVEQIRERFWSKVAITANPDRCWEWRAQLTTTGYGHITYHHKDYPAHRFAWFLVYGNHPNPNLCILHSCDNRLCVNPNHLREGTISENALDSVKRGRHFFAKQTHCKRGHEYNTINTLYYRSRSANVRKCRICSKIYQQNARNKSETKGAQQ